MKKLSLSVLLISCLLGASLGHADIAVAPPACVPAPSNQALAATLSGVNPAEWASFQRFTHTNQAIARAALQGRNCRQVCEVAQNTGCGGGHYGVCLDCHVQCQ